MFHRLFLGPTKAELPVPAEKDVFVRLSGLQIGSIELAPERQIALPIGPEKNLTFFHFVVDIT